MPSVRVNPFEFLDDFMWQKLESWGYPSVKICDPSLHHFDAIPEHDRQVNGHTDNADHGYYCALHIYGIFTHHKML